MSLVTRTPVESEPVSVVTLITIPTLENTYEALFFGMLYGITLFQLYRYYRLYPKDQTWLKFMVFFILSAETVHTIAVVHLCYFHLLVQFFNPLGLLVDVWSLRLLAPLQAVMMLLCQSFYVRRVKMFGTRYKTVVALAVALLFTEFGCMIYVIVLAFKDQEMEDLGKFTWIISVVYGLALAVDVIVTAVLIVILLKSRTGFRSTDSLIQTLVVYSINSGLTTSIAGTLTFIFALVLPGNMIYLAMSAVSAKLYANSVLAVLNARRFLSEQAMDGFTTDSVQLGGNTLQPAMSTVAFAEQGPRLASTLSVSPTIDSESDATTQRDSVYNHDVGEAAE